MKASQLILLMTFAASSYNVGTIWMVHIGYKSWPIVGPSEFAAYHRNWWLQIIPVIFPIAFLGFAGSLAMTRWKPANTSLAAIWLSVAFQTATYVLTAIFWARWQAQLRHARLPDSTLDPVYLKIMSTHYFRVALLTANWVTISWIAIQHEFSKP